MMKKIKKEKIGKSRTFFLACGVISSALTMSVARGSFAQVACLPIDQVIVKNVTLFDETQVKSWVSDYQGRCLGIEEFNQILERVSNAYVDAGYITSRPYLPEQDLADGSFEIEVVEGKIDTVTFNGERNDRWQRVVYPDISGHIANLREIEQGLDTIRTMPTYEADMELIPGEETGTSVLAIKAVSKRPYQITFSTNNYGQSPLPEFNSSVAISYDNLFSLNETLTLKYSKGVNPTPLNFEYKGIGSSSWGLSGRFPYGKWVWDLGYDQSVSNQVIEGVFSEIPVRGESSSFSVSGKRLIHRDQVSKTYTTFSLNRDKNENKIADVLLESSSRVVTNASVSIIHQRPIKGFNFYGSATLDKGLKILNAEDFDKMPKGQPNAQFTKLDLYANLNRQWQYEKGTLSYDGTLSAQFSGDRLYSSQQFSLGGPSTVRGIKSSIASGSSGFLLKQEFEFAPKSFQIKGMGNWSYYAGLDYGQIFSQPEIDVKSFEATGGAFGLRLKGNGLNMDFGYSNLICLGCEGFSSAYDSGVYTISFSKTF